MVENPSANAGDTRNMGLIPWHRKIPWRRKWQPIPVFLPEIVHGERSLVGCSPWGHKESGMIYQLNNNSRVYLYLTLILNSDKKKKAAKSLAGIRVGTVSPRQTTC